MLHEQWQEQTFAAHAATNHHRTEGVRTKPTSAKVLEVGQSTLSTRSSGQSFCHLSALFR